ncbi:acyltransferase family protein [Legionella tunisiensis]|uniref:acyltransferase family protein n=1 Tax=Legionella tunisiensis TaxID=1034944 RepID=UPI000311B6C8|nr:hypothetical protein [Legionella tunisiensis]
MFLNAFPYHFDFATIRVFGVLQRIAICYFFAAFILTTRPKTQLIITLILLLSYWWFMAFWPVPGYGANHLAPQANLAAYVDRLFFSSSHLYGKVYDPEGLLSTLPAIATALLGNLTGIGLLTTTSQQKKLAVMSMVGISALIIGWLWGLWFPINKALWTSSYVLRTGGWALLVLAFCYWTIEIKGWKRGYKPFEIFGANAMAAYVLHIFFLKVQLMVTIPNQDGSPGNLRSFITEHLFGWASPPNASLLYALSYTFFWLVILTILYRKKIYIRI